MYVKCMQQSANINVDFLQTYLHIPYDTHMIDKDFLGPVVPSPLRNNKQRKITSFLMY